MKIILIIEDESVQREAYELKLGQKYQLAFAKTGNEVLSYLDPLPDLIVLDIMLPGGKNGFDVLQSLKENPKTKSIPVIMLTNLGVDQEQTALDLGATEFHTKTDVTLDIIESIIEKYV